MIHHFFVRFFDSHHIHQLFAVYSTALSREKAPVVSLQSTHALMSSFKNTSSKSPSIAIIGGGFAGLTLANYLSSKHYECIVLEAKEEPIPIIGTIRLPLAFTVLKELNLAQDPSLSQSLVHNNDQMDRQLFLNLLRQRLVIRYSCRVERIDVSIIMENQHNNHSKKTHLVWDDQGRSHGPFDHVVAANGLCLKSLPWFQQVSAVVGDVRWQYDTWFWDFGRQRIQRGGNIALADARELAQAFLSILTLTEATTNPLVQIPIKFQPQHHHRHHRWHTSRLVFLSIVVAFLCRMVLTLERI